MNKQLQQSYNILSKLRLDNGMYIASPSNDYHYVWLRDTFYEVLPYLNSDDDRYEKTYHRILDLLKEYKWKIDIHSSEKPVFPYQYIHARYEANTVTELHMEWGHAQHDAVGAILFGIAEGVRVGKDIIRDDSDRHVIQSVVNYLACCEYWQDPDNGMWEEWKEVHASSVGAVVAGLRAISKQNIADVPHTLIQKGKETLNTLLPRESDSRPIDLSLLSLIYPYNVVDDYQKEQILYKVETLLLRERGVIRYLGDSYYSTIEKSHGRHLPLGHYYGTEAEWTFGLPWLALVHMSMGNNASAREYLARTEKVMLEDGSLPELYFANSDKYNGNTPLGWANAMYILAKEMYNKDVLNLSFIRKKRKNISEEELNSLIDYLESVGIYHF